MNRLSSVLFAIFVCAVAQAQVVPPLGPAQDFYDGVNPPAPDFEIPYGPATAALELPTVPPFQAPPGQQAIVWLERSADADRAYMSVVTDREIDSPLANRQLLLQLDRSPVDFLPRLGSPSVAAVGDGVFVVVIPRFDIQPIGGSLNYRKEFLYRIYQPLSNAAPQPMSAAFDAPTASLNLAEVLFEDYTARIDRAPDTVHTAATPFGRFALVFADDRNPEDQTLPTAPMSTDDNSVHFALFDIDRSGPPGEWSLVALSPTEPAAFVTNSAEAFARPRIGLNPNSGAVTIVYRRADGALMLAPFDPAGLALGGPVVIRPVDDTIQRTVHDPDVSVDVQGNAWVAWELNKYQTSDDPLRYSRIVAQRFTASGAPLGGLREVSTANPAPPLHRMFVRRRPVISALDLQGHVAVAWNESETACAGFNPPPNDFFGSCQSNVVPAGGAICKTSNLNGTTVDRSGCRISARLIPNPELPSSGWYVFARDTSRDLIMDDGPDRTIDVQVQRNVGSLNRCAIMELSGNGGYSEIRFEQLCASPPCQTCAQQTGLSAEKFRRTTTTIAAGDEAAAQPLVAKGNAGGRPQDVAMRWLHRDSAQPEFTFVGQFPANDRTVGNQSRAAIAQYRDGDMLAVWAGDPDPSASADIEVVSARRFSRPVELSVNDIGILEGPLEATGTFTVSASKAHPLSGVVPTVGYLTEDDTASFLSDYTRTTGTLQFSNGSTSQFVPVPVEEDRIYEDSETFFLNLFSATNAVLVKRQAIGVIIDNDPPQTIIASNVSICESGAEVVDGSCPSVSPPVTPNSTVQIRLTLQEVQEVDGSVRFRTVDGTTYGNPVTSVPAVAGTDYEPVTGEAQFPAGSREAVVSVEIMDNALQELEKNFSVELFDAEDLTLNAEFSTAIVRIVNDDACTDLPQVTLPDNSDRVDFAVEGGVAFACVRNHDPATCSWSSELNFGTGANDWLTLTEHRNGPQTALTGCSADDTGYVELEAASNVPPKSGSKMLGQTRSAFLEFTSVQEDQSSYEVRQAGLNCELRLTPSELSFYPVGGTAEVLVETVQLDGDVGICAGATWNLLVSPVTDQSWLSIDNSPGVSGVGATTVNIEVAPLSDATGDCNNPAPGRCNTLENLQIFQEAVFFDHFDNGQKPTGWVESDPAAWSESGTRLRGASTEVQTILAQPAFPGCLACQIETAVRQDLFGKGLGIIYAWYLDADNHIYLSMDEFRDQWRLVQRRNGADEVLRLYAADILPNTEYALALSYDAENGVIELEINGVSVCPPAISGQNQCLPQALSAGTFGFGVDNAAVSFDLIRVVRSDGPRYTEIVVDPIHADGFE